MKKKAAFFLLIVAFLFSCGIEEYYYLPQVPQGSIIPENNTNANVNFPPISSSYADSYMIFYRIYISTLNIDGDFHTNTTQMNQVNTQLANDYSIIFPSTDPGNTTATVSAENLFRARGYFELELYGSDLSSKLVKTGGSLVLSFPTETGGTPTANINGGSTDDSLYRSKSIIYPEPDRYFRNTAELMNSDNATSNINADVQRISSGDTPQHAYVNMYIVAAGVHPTNFTRIYSKPTHINIFKLPNTQM